MSTRSRKKNDFYQQGFTSLYCTIYTPFEEVLSSLKQSAQLLYIRYFLDVFQYSIESYKYDTIFNMKNKMTHPKINYLIKLFNCDLKHCNFRIGCLLLRHRTIFNLSERNDSIDILPFRYTKVFTSYQDLSSQIKAHMDIHLKYLGR